MYATLAQVRASAQGMTAQGVPVANDDLVRDLIERASRMIDRECGVSEGYFESALYPVWESLQVYFVGDIVTPTTPNAHKYRVTTAGTSGASEPTWPTSSAGTVTNGTVVFTEYGADVVASARTFYGDGTNHLKVDPYVPGTLSATITVPTGYTAADFIEKNGYLVQAADPTSGVVATFNNRGMYSSYWTAGVPVTVTAKWGFAETPADIRQAVIELAINLWRETDAATSKLVGIDGLIQRESFPPRVREIVKFRRLSEAKAVFA